MAQKHINIGTPNNEDGDFVRDAFSYSEDNFTELYALQFYTDRILSASVAQIGPLTFEVLVNGWIKNGTVYPIINPFVFDTVVLSAADPTDNRIDVIAITDSETIVVIEGTPSPNPEEPLVDFDTQLKVTSVLVPAGGTPSFTTVTVYDENAGEPGEFATTESTGGVRINLASTTDPDLNSNHIETTNWISGNAITFTNDVPLSLSSFSALRLRIKKKNTAVSQIRVRFFNGGTLVSLGNVFIQNGQYGFLDSNTSTYQTVIMSPLDFNFVGGTFTRIVLTCTNNNGADVKIDDVTIIYDTGDVGGGSGTYLSLSDTVDTTYTGKNGYVPSVTTESGLTLVPLSTLETPQNLQSVLDTGDTATSNDTNSSISLNLLDSGFGNFSFIKSNGSDTSQITQSLSSIQLYQNYFNKESGVSLFEGNLNFFQRNTGGTNQTGISFTVPIANTTLNFPAKTIGTYNLATSITNGTTTVDADSAGILNISTLVDPSPFQSLNEGSGIGYVFRGSNRANYSNVGFGAFDFGYYYTDATQGATGTYSVILSGEDNKATGYANIVLGGYGNQASDNYTFIVGEWNVANDFGSKAIGTALISKSNYSLFVGTANVDYTEYVAFNDGRQPLFGVGNGALAAGNPPNVSSRSDAFTVLRSGKVGINIDNFPDDTVGAGLSSSILQLQGSAQFRSYGGGTVTGTPTYNLAVSSTGEIIETAYIATVNSVAPTSGNIALTPNNLLSRVEENAAVTTTKTIDWGAYETFYYTMTGATIFSETNLPAAGFSKVITLHMTGNFAPTYPAGWSTYITGTYDGTVLNIFTIEYVAAASPFYKVQIVQPD